MNETKLDAQETLFFERELEKIKSKTYDKKYPELKIRKLVPVNSDVDPGADTITYWQYDSVGMAKIVESYAKDFPRVDVKKEQFSSPVRSLGDSYGYSIQEIRKARMAGTPLEQRRANTARKAMMQAEDEFGSKGDTKSGLGGLFTNANSTEYILPADGNENGGSSSKEFRHKTPAQILRDLNGMVNTPVDITNGVETVDTLLMPISVYTLISSTARSENSDTTILQYFMRNNPFIQNVDHYHKLKNLGAGGTGKLFAYRRDPDVLTLEIPQDFEQFPPQEEGMEFVVYCHERFGGVIIYYPLATIFADGVSPA